MAQKVLVVDDDPIMHRVLKHYLERNGYEMLGAKTGREGVDIAKQELPRVIVLDVRMPEMSGLAALRELKESESTRTIPVIIVTVSADRTTQLESKVSGADAFLLKPFRPGELLEQIKNLAPPEVPKD
ncbi:MAG TPA: response regulator [Verrucomicrobiae bacterium]|jgi:twitching motility two-component system response regulator PilH|nr:response regulator [Verrucomicrobiae bacterium]